MSLLTIWKPLFQPKIYDKFDTEKFHDFFFLLERISDPNQKFNHPQPCVDLDSLLDF